MFQILIAEDEVRIASFIEKGLRKHGYSTVVAKDGVEAIAMLNQGSFDLLLLDLGLPGKDGWAVLHELRTQMSSDLPVIIVTAHDDAENRVKSPQFGVKAHILKPFKFSDLLKRIRLLL